MHRMRIFVFFDHALMYKPCPDCFFGFRLFRPLPGLICPTVIKWFL